MQKITPCLWFEGNAEEAVNLYTSVIKDSKIGMITHYDRESSELSGMKEASVMTIEFTIGGQEFLALNGGPDFKFTPAVSFIIKCDNQKEIDYLWERLSEGGEKDQCGWVKDMYGVTWQIVPKILDELMQGDDPHKIRTMNSAMYKMHKLIIDDLKRAYDEG